MDAFLAEVRAANADGSGLTLALAERGAPARLIGLVGIGRDAGAEAPHFGYWLGRAFWGRGLMGEAVAALVHAYRAYAGGGRLIAEARIDNPRSRRVLERAGFAAVGQLVRSPPLRGGTCEVDRFHLERPGSAAAGRGAQAA